MFFPLCHFVQPILPWAREPVPGFTIYSLEQAVFQRLGQNEYNLIDLVKCLGDFDPVELTGNFAESSDSRDSCSCAEYQDGTPIVKVKGNLKLNVAF